ncbi:MAG: hypothetical protein HAW59_05075 [Betaproteobacteria bacterium]|nr:hypothetical protein [Betaproteobacteria bacterium]
MSGGFQWRSPLAFAFDEQTQWGESENAAIAETVDGESETAARLAGVCDLSPLPRIGALGKCAKTPPINAAKIAADGAMVCRLGDAEILVLAAPGGGAVRAENFMPSPRMLVSRRDSHCLLGLGGARAAETLARLCAVPPPKFPALLQTRVAEISALVIPEPRIAVGAFYLLADIGYAEHIWDEVRAVAERLGGGVHGRKQWLALMAE